MTKLVLDDLEVRACLKRETGRPTSKVVQANGWKPALLDHGAEGPGQAVGGHRPAALGGEDVATAVLVEEGEVGLLEVAVTA
ncbi:hypothetical protein ABGB14_29480 [Nonomuraea sp. B10E15]|uniref:hypothetical protein n=1 Tax=Nonomuraea sp. B10E15 TaxID=3153560 RepID=UPI00325D1098